MSAYRIHVEMEEVKEFVDSYSVFKIIPGIHRIRNLRQFLAAISQDGS